MTQTENTAIVLRYANYKENDRMLTLFSPTRGRVDAVCRGCRRPKSPLLNASELFALGDFELYEKNGRQTVTAAHLIETFYPLRADYDRLTCGIWALNLCEAVIQPNQNDQELFMLLLHTLSRLTFSDQPWPPLLTGFLLRFAGAEGFKPRLQHCVRCGKRLNPEEPCWFDLEEGGVVGPECRQLHDHPLEKRQLRWLNQALSSPASAWVSTPEAAAPFYLMKAYVEHRLDRKLRSAAVLPLPQEE
ncbi:MAG: DNA repair protein RecO [Clostridia bacterium]|nr:DNA repair protein RecO [Clostridia bacterium]